MSDDWKWRDSDWNNPSQPGDNGPSFLNQPTVTPSWNSETLGASENTIGPPPPPPLGSEAAYSWQDPSTPPFSSPSYDGPSAYTPPPYAAPPSFGPPPSYTPSPVARAAPWAFMLARGCLPFFISLLVLAGIGAGIAFAVFGSVNPGTVINKITSNPGALTGGPTAITVGTEPKIVIDRNDGSVHVTAGQDGKVTIQATGNTYGGGITYQKSENVITFNLDGVETNNVNLTVPPLADLDITTNAGDITVDGVSGQISLSTNGSSITATHVTFKGTSKMDVNGGNITFNGALDPASNDDFENNDGIIGLTFPANGAFHVDATCNGTEIASDFPEIVVSGDEAHGDVGNAPRATVTVSTNAGTIHIYKGPAA
jgi:hypothetical protein